LKTTICIILSLLFVEAVFGQDTIKQHKIDSLKAKLCADSAHIYRFRKVRPFFSLDNRNSFIKDAPVNVQGLQLGLILKERHTLGFGFYTLQANAKQNITTKNDKYIDVNRTLSLNYLTAFYQYAIFDTRYFELDLPLELGLGGYDVKLTDAVTNKVVLDKKGGTIIIGGGVGVTIKPLKWFGITGSAGYRNALDNNPNVNFSGFFYSYGVWVGLGQIYRDARYCCIKRKKCRRHIHYILNEK
jgi:hypothetical protein